MKAPWSPTAPFSHSAGPKHAKIALVGEALGKQEAMTGLPFQGYSGQELTRMLKDAGLDKRDCFQTQVFNVLPEDGKIESLCASKTEVGADYPLHSFAQGKYIKPEYLPELERLKQELEQVSPNLVVALGATACWALLQAKLTAIRGTIALSPVLTGLKVLPTFSPGLVLRMWANRPVMVADLMKARREGEFPEIRRPSRTVLVNPTLSEMESYFAQPHAICSVDIETTHGQMASIGFASTRHYSMVVPFITDSTPPRSYWPDLESEVIALSLVKNFLERPIPKLFQNGMYDLQYIVALGIKPWNCIHDTMLLHHALYPEMRKGLGFLGSIYTDEASWKLLGGRTDSTKREE